jgi:hypothetical protein
MVNTFTPTSGQVAQAIYTWSTRLVNLSKGTGFSTISPSLEGSIDWLTRLQPPEFKLFTTNSPSPKLYEARVGFSETGRTVRGQISIVYCKTADGTVDVTGRSQPVVHALLTDVSTLGLLNASRIRQDFWIRAIGKTSEARLELCDMSLKDVADAADLTADHTCPEGHDDAIDFLSSLLELKIRGEENIIVPSYPDALAQMVLVFPPNVVDGFTHTPYITVEGVQHEIGLRLPFHNTGSGHEVSSLKPWSETCPLKRAAGVAAAKYLFSDDASIGKYVEAVLAASAPQSVFHMVSLQKSIHEAEGSEDPLVEVMQSIHDLNNAQRFTDRESLELLERLRLSEALTIILDADTALLLEAFGDISDESVISTWSLAWADVDTKTFIDLWNKTHIAAFLGIVLLRNLKPGSKLQHRISADRGVKPDVTRLILRSMRSQPHGGESIARVMQAGFGSTESMRMFICQAFVEWPDYLYDVILGEVDTADTRTTIDLIRFGYDSWAQHRGLSEQETLAFRVLLRPSFFDRIKVIFGRQSSQLHSCVEGSSRSERATNSLQVRPIWSWLWPGRQVR